MDSHQRYVVLFCDPTEEATKYAEMGGRKACLAALFEFNAFIFGALAYTSSDGMINANFRLMRGLFGEVTVKALLE